MVANLIFHKYQWQKSSSFMLISESSYIHVQRPLVIHDLLGFRHFFFLSTYKRLFNNELYSFIERGKSNISIDTQCKEIRAESLNDIVINRRICRHPESLQLMRVLSGCQGLLFVKPPLKPTLPTFSLHVLWLRLLYVLLFPSVDRRWCYVSDFVVNVSGACQAACTALQCCWHLWDYPPPLPPPLSPGPILSHWRVQYMYHVTSWSPNTVQQIQEMKGLRFDWRTLASFQNAPIVGLNIPIQQEYW